MFKLTLEGDIALLGLSRPERRNAISIEAWSLLQQRLGELGEAKVLILTGDQDAFCAGADISEFGSFEDDPALIVRFRAAMRGALDGLRNLEIPTFAVVEGACYGAGVALAMACDIRIASPSATFAITPAKLGISYPQEDVHRLVNLVRPGQAARLLLSAQRIDGAEAARIGLVDILAAAEAGALAHRLASSIAANEPASLSALKHSISLAEQGVRQDDGQDLAFDRLFSSSGFSKRLKDMGAARK